MIQLPPDFKEFLRLLTSEGVEYLVVGGHAVAFHGYPRATGDLDVWIAVGEENARRMAEALRRFGFADESVDPSNFLEPDKILRMGMPPLRIEILTGASGVDFRPCYDRRVTVRIDDVDVSMIGLDDLRANKRAAGRHKDLADLDELAD